MATGKLYASYVAKANNGEINFSSGAIKAVHLKNTYTPAQATHDYYDDVNAHVVTGTNITAGGQAVASKTVTLVSLTQQFDAADTTFTNITTNSPHIRYTVVYLDTGTASTSPLIGYIDWGSDLPVVGGDFTVRWAATGIFTGTVA